MDSPDPAVLPEHPHHPGRLQERYQANSFSLNVVFTLRCTCTFVSSREQQILLNCCYVFRPSIPKPFPVEIIFLMWIRLKMFFKVYIFLRLVFLWIGITSCPLNLN